MREKSIELTLRIIIVSMNQLPSNGKPATSITNSYWVYKKPPNITLSPNPVTEHQISTESDGSMLYVYGVQGGLSFDL